MTTARLPARSAMGAATVGDRPSAATRSGTFTISGAVMGAHMTKAKYRTPEHRRQRAMWRPVVERGDGYCAETICLEERDGYSRWINPAVAWDVAHSVDGMEYLGPAHARCNRSEGARRGNRERGGVSAARWVL